MRATIERLFACTTLLVCGCASLPAQVSPGPLSKAHHFLDSPLKCASCHTFGEGRKLRCLTCHGEIRELIARHEGFHGRNAKTAKGDLDCARCHTEHYGEKFQIYQWPTSKDEFDHRTTGYPLLGRHAGLACAQCHNARHIAEADRKRIMVKDLNRTFEGLHTACLTCHEDHHAGQLGPDCGRCHDVNHWKPGGTFDHSTSHFPLTGRHQEVACGKCHRPSAADAKVIQYKGLPFAQCTGCHQDPHHGAFAARCESCHNTESWRRVQLTNAFDHDRTKFPLHGKHQGLACGQCHKDPNFKAPTAHAKCMDCHQDRHQGQFQHRADHGECGACHTEQGWRPSTFSESNHQSTTYPLTGKHATVACAKCHLPAGPRANYHPAFQKCGDCHQDPHSGQFASAPHGNRCEDCHDVHGFQPSLYTFKQHQSSAFVLKGAHAAVACQDCHRKDDSLPGGGRRYHFTSQSCQACHQDPHAGEFPAAMKKGDLCESCHGVTSWQELKRFDHSTTGYPLEGAHAVLSCGGCHRPGTAEKTVREVRFKLAPERCEGCHEDIHAGQFQRDGKPVECAACHTPARWTATKFDHNSSTTFSLKGAHENVPCRLCHTEHRQSNGRSVEIFNGTPRECAACHR